MACRWETEIETLESDNSTKLQNTGHSKGDSSGEDKEDDLSDSLIESIDSEISRKSRDSSSEISSVDLELEEFMVPATFRPPAVALKEKLFDFDILQPPHDIDLITMIEKFVAPRLPDGLHWCIPPTNKAYIKSRQRSQYLIAIARIANLEAENKSNRKKLHKNPKRLQNFIKNAANLHRSEPGELFPVEVFDQIEILNDNNSEEEEKKAYNYRFSQLLKVKCNKK